MKTAKQYVQEMYPSASRPDILELEYSTIQRDALEWALDCMKHNVPAHGMSLIAQKINEVRKAFE